MEGGTNTVAVTVVVTPAALPHQPGHTPATHYPGHLAWTGSPIDTLTAVATGAFLAGTFLLTAFRRRAHRPTSWGTS